MFNEWLTGPRRCAGDSVNSLREPLHWPGCAMGSIAGPCGHWLYPTDLRVGSRCRPGKSGVTGGPMLLEPESTEWRGIRDPVRG